ncbi:type IV pilus twitching motility protein PilT [Conyzicola lurida]|uniref:type IV pilus twitching motility protein PilT n=1 Tax=Conyzicola lurida TaxID=1172621 RepID=UPI0031B5AC18
MPTYDPDGELPPPPPSNAFNPASYLNAPPPTTPPASFGSYTQPPPPPGYEQPFDPTGFPPPFAAADPSAPPVPFGSEQNFDAAFDPAAFAPPTGAYETTSYDSAFDPTAFAAPATDYTQAFDPSAYTPPTSYDEAFDPNSFAAPPAPAAPSFEDVLFAPVDESVPVFDTSAFDMPAPTAAVPPTYEAPIPEAAAPAAPAWEAPAAAAATASAAPAAPAAPAWEAPAATAPVWEAPAPTPAVPAPVASAAPVADLQPPAPAVPSYTLPIPVEAPTEVLPTAAPVVAPAATLPKPAAAPVASSIPGESLGRHAERPEPTFDASAPIVPATLPQELGVGQVGSDLDLVAALNAVVQLRASDLHIGVNAVPMIRVDGGLRPIPGFEEWDADKVMTALHSIMSPEHRDLFANELELDFAYTLSEKSRFRVNIYQQRNVLGAAFRLIPTEIKQLAALGIPERIGKFAQLPRGLVLVTGPTGSGKSTTLAALIDLVNSTRADHIVTVEDPIEFMHENKKSLVNQREVGHDTHSFNNALKHVLRQDPDVILIGELRDLETISVALTAAETGHLVFATLHTQDAPQTIDRVIDVFPPHQQDQVRAQLAATLQGVVCQTLIKKAHGEGRAVATEVLITTPAVANLIREGKTYQIHSAMQAGREMGMHTMDQHLADLVNARQITHQAAHEKAHDLEDLKQLISRSEVGGGGQDFSGQASGINFDDSFSNKGA